MIRRPPRSTHCISSAASDVYKRQVVFSESICAIYYYITKTMDFFFSNPIEIDFESGLMDALENVPLLIDYFATCGVRQKDLIDYVNKYQPGEVSLHDYLKPESLKKNSLVPDVTGRYPPVDRPSAPFPLDIPNFCFSCGYKLETKEGLAAKFVQPSKFIEEAKTDNGFVPVSALYTKGISFVQTNESAMKTYVS
eukprot:TRINITY_DN6126_c0_g1_i4.p1 TRINITY_DN6126_c0_g1~~TRINITY_DN6126_c0_g1_i4.p1  ORF type:complete len:207 (+),score=49.12 TRINITY_DN6126_c0_g1_i4:38-622(+)